MRVHPGTLLLAAAVAAQSLTLPDWMRSSQRDLPPEVFPSQKSAQPAAPTPTPGYADEPFVFEQVRRRVRFENDGTGRRETEVRVRIQSDAAVQAFGLLAFGYNSANERLDIDRVEVRKPSGEVITATTDNIQDLALPVAQEAPVYSDFRQRHVTVPSLRPGDTLSYRATVTTTTALVPGQFWFAHDFERQGIVLDETLTLDLPASRQVILKVQPGVEAAATEAAAADRIVRTWHSTHLARDAKKTEPAKAPQMAIQLTTFRTWEEVASWYFGLVGSQTPRDPAIVLKAEELTRGKTLPLDKLEALSDYVAHNIRYVSLSFGIGRYEPHRAAEVLAHQYGDCKDKHALLAALAGAVGLQVLPVLANSSRPIDRDVPSPAQFDHVISVMNTGNDRKGWIWTDTTVPVAPFRLLMPSLRGKTLLLAANTLPHQALIDTPKGLPVQPSDRISITGKLSDPGQLDMHVSVLRRGDMELVFRITLNRLPRARWSEFGDALAKGSWIGGSVTDFTATDPMATHEPFTLGYRQVRDNYVAWDEHGHYRMPLPLERVLMTDTTEDDWKGSEPVEMGEFEADMHVQLTMPDSVTIQAPVDVSVVRDYADYKATYRVDGHTLTVDRVIHCKVAELPTSRGADYLAFVRAIRADEEQRVELTRKGGAPASPASPTSTDNWNNKGLAQLAANQLDQAEASFRKQIEINAFDPWAHNNLGRVLRLKHQYAEAEAAFRKQIDVNPLDQYAWNNLGSMLNQRGQYAEARTALEKAVSITPDDAALRVTLGGLYLHLKLDAEGMAAFEKAVQISPTPPIWNDIAYALGNNGVHLDRAQQYAESAINGHATMLRETTLDKLTPAQLRLVMSLAADWDTLGWILFKRGDLAGAERYLRAAWILAQNGEGGDHLGQTYEKQGKRKEAIGVYAEALGTRSAPEETAGRLDRLIKAGPGGAAATPLDKLMTQSVSAIIQLRTISIPRPAGMKPADEVYARALVLLDSTSKTAEVKFVGAGSADAPPALADGLRTAPYPMPWPDTTATRLVRRVRVHCEVDAKTCLVLLEHPNEVRTPEP